MPARAEALIRRLDLQPHPEGGHYRRIHPLPQPAQRGALSAIHFLLPAGEVSAWHRVDAEEVWHYVEGDPLELLIYRPELGTLRRLRLGPLPERGEAQSLLGMVPAGAWQAARPLGAYTLCSCLVAPAFEFAGFSLVEDAALARRLAALAPDFPVAVEPAHDSR
ncbi:cupin domain-containing protein [Frateuria defendens]|uniref:cupin domain-containing protein n=1 Tax=Frateuria defendens TaxID=2219559 RepID=UPI00066FEDE8|nr:cupin domain-containing protein [Frateuria defendens]